MVKSLRTKYKIIPWSLLTGELKHYWVALLIVIIGTFISLFAFKFYRQEDLNSVKSEYEHIADSRLLILQNTLDNTFLQLEYIRHFFKIANSQLLTKANFHAVALHSLTEQANILAIGWKSPEIPLGAHLNELPGFNFISQLLPDIEFISSDPEDSRHNKFYSLDLLELGYIRQPFYFDLNSYIPFVESLKESQGSQHTIVSNPIDYFQDGDKTGFFIFESLFTDPLQVGSPQLIGTLIAFSDFEKILDKARSKVEPIGINFSIYEWEGGTEKLIYFSPSTEVIPDPLEMSMKDLEWEEQWSRSYNINVGNKIWKLKATPTLDFISRNQKLSYWEVPIIGILLSTLTALYFLVLVNRRILIEHEVHQRTIELAESNRLLQDEIGVRRRIQLEMTKHQLFLQKGQTALEHLTKLTTSELKIAIQEVLHETAAVLQVTRVSIWFYEHVEEHLVLNCAGLYNLETDTFTEHLEFVSTYYPHYFQALTLHNDLIIPSIEFPEVNQELGSYLTAFHILSKMDIPIIFEGNLLGILAAEETRLHREWELEDRHFGHTVADIIAIMIEQSGRRKAEKALQESEEKLLFVTQKSIDAIVSVSDKNEIDSWNYGAEQMFGYSEAEMKGQPLNTIIPEQQLDEVKAAAKPIELISKHKNGRIFPIELSHTSWRSGNQTFETVIIRDITERKEYEKRLIKAMREAKAANQAKSEFLTTVSHELRTPLNAVVGYNQCLLMGMDGPISEQQKISLKKIEKSSFHLLNLINDILDLSKIEASKMELEITPQNIVETVTSCVDEIQSLAQQKDLKVELKVSKPYILMEYDKTRIRQVLLNLLGNAVKFTKKGSIKVTLNNFSDHIDIQIADTGIGLSAEEISRLFVAFSQADSSITRKYGGSGLGLAISKDIVDLHGGKITVESIKGEGSMFTITLPKIQ